MEFIQEKPSSSQFQGLQNGAGRLHCNICRLTGRTVTYNSRQRYLAHLKLHNKGFLKVFNFKVERWI